MMKRCKLAIPLLVFGVAVAQRDACAGAGPDGGIGPALVRTDKAATSDREELAGGNPLWAVPLGVFRATRERPLFSASRRPPAPPVVAVAEPPPPPRAPPPPASRPSLVLLGTIIGGASRIGIFFDEATARATRLMVGERHDGWVLRAGTAAAWRVGGGGRG